MKKIILRSAKTGVVIVAAVSLLASCNKDNGLIDVAYPDQGIYFAQAAVANVGPNANGIYTITANFENQAQRFKADVAGGKLNIPLGIVRSGITTNGTQSVSVGVNTDTVTKFIAAGKFVVITDPLATTEILPASAYTLPASVDMADGATDAGFTLSVNLSFLINSYTATPKKRYAIGIVISNTNKTAIVKPGLATTIILIDPAQVIPPTANFSTYVYKETKTGNVVNLATNGVSYSWNFGDGTPAVTDVTPNHVYAASGTYVITLTATGIAGSGPASVKTASVVIP